MFGRRKQEDEDPFAALKQGGTYESKASATLPGVPGSTDLSQPVAQPTPVAPSATITAPSATSTTATTAGRPSQNRTRAPRQRRPRRARGGAGGLIARIAIPLVIAAVVIGVASKGSNDSNGSGVSVNIPSLPNIGSGLNGGIDTNGSGTSSGSRSRKGSSSHGRSNNVVGPGKTAGPASYLTEANLRAGIARVERMAPGSKLLLLRIDSTSLDATVAAPHGAAKEISFVPSGTFQETVGTPGSRAIPFSQINPAVPPRLVSEMRTKFHVPASRIDYLVAFWFQGLPPFWGVYLKNDTNYQASLSGAGLHKNG